MAQLEEHNLVTDADVRQLLSAYCAWVLEHADPVHVRLPSLTQADVETVSCHHVLHVASKMALPVTCTCSLCRQTRVWQC